MRSSKALGWPGRVAALAVLLCLPTPRATAAPSSKKVRVAIVADHAHDEASAKAYADAIQSVASGESFEVQVLDARRGDSKADTIRGLVDAVLADKNVDVVLAIGALGSSEGLRRTGLAKPFIAANVLDPALLSAPKTGEASAVKNLTYVADPGALGRDLATLKELGLSRPALLVGKEVLAGIPELGKKLGEKAKATGLAATVVAVDAARSADALAQVPSDADGVVLVLVDELTPAGIAELLRGAEAKKLRSYSVRGVVDVTAGVCAGLADAKEAEQHVRRAAIDVSRVAGGEAAAVIPVGYQRSETLTVNVGAARRAGWALPFAVLSEADTIGEAQAPATAGEKISLRGVADEVVAKNLDFAAGKFRLDSAKEDEAKAVSYLLPKASAALQGVMIDESRAAASFGTQAERQLLGVLEAKGLIFSDKVWANLSIQEKLTLVREAMREAERLDLVLDGAKSYLGVLQTAVLEKVRVENAKRTRANLGVARSRQGAGSAMASEVLRWEAQLATDRREVLKARAYRSLAEMQLNRLRHRPLQEALAVSPDAFEAEMKLIVPDELLPLIADANAFAALGEVMVEEGLARSPELKAADQAVLASERAVSAMWRTVYVPELGFAGRLFARLAKGGAGKDPPAVDPTPLVGPFTLEQVQALGGVLGGVFPGPISDPSWEIAAQLSIPLPIDLAPFSDIRRAEADLEQRKRERDAGKEKIEQRIRSAGALVAASFPGVQLAREAAAAAQKNLALVQEAYAAGAIGYLDVLDARNAALLTEQGAINAVYELMTDELQLERSVGWYRFMAEKEERDAWVKRVIDRLARR